MYDELKDFSAVPTTWYNVNVQSVADDVNRQVKIN